MQDKVTCKEFDFPVVLSGHDHHVVNETFHDTLLLKPGSDANKAVILDLTWEDDSVKGKDVKLKAEVVEVEKWEANEELNQKVEKAYKILDYLRNTKLSDIPEEFRPLSSVGSREKVCTVGRFICTSLKKAINEDDNDEVLTFYCLINDAYDD